MSTDREVSVAGLARVHTSMAALIDSLGEAQWTRATPCPEWDVRSIVHHLVVASLVVASRLRGGPPVDRDADHLGDDPAGAYRTAAVAAEAAFATPGALEGTYPSPLGEVPGTTVLALRIGDNLVHGWDIARATGLPANLPEDVAGAALDRLRTVLGGVPRDGRFFGAEQAVAAGAPATDRLAAFAGRSVTVPA
jgi:uncharacterized protein (TIGR03086 family)